MSSLYTVYTAQLLTANTNLTFTQWTTKYLDKNKLIAKVVASPLQIPFLSSFFFPTFNILSQLRPSKNFFPFINLPTSKTERKKRGISTVLKVMLPFTPAIGAASFVVKTIIDSLVMPSKYASKKKVLQQAKQLEQLRLGHNDIVNAVNEVASQIASIDAKFDLVITSTAIASIESDLKTLIQYLETALQLTLLKYEAALSAAQDSRTSPYTLSQKDLIELASKTHTQTRLTLDTNINNVRTSAIGYENKITFIIEVPILDDDKYFNFYSIKPIPEFSNNETFYPDIDATNIAISSDGNKYVVLDQNEFDRCMDIPSICNSHLPIQPLTNKATCVITTFTNNKPTCPSKSFNTPPFIFLYFDKDNNRMFYSAPPTSSIFIKCALQNGNYEDKTVHISGIGVANYRSDCSINLADGTNYKTPLAVATEDIGDLPILDVVAITPGNHTFDPSKQFRLNRTDVHAGYISPPVNSQASKANIDWWNILTLIIATIIPITVLTILKYFCTNFYNTYCCTNQNQNSSSPPPSPTFRRSSSPKPKSPSTSRPNRIFDNLLHEPLVSSVPSSTDNCKLLFDALTSNRTNLIETPFGLPSTSDGRR